MKKIIKILWSMIPLGIVVFIIIMYSAKSDVAIWRAFSIIMPAIVICFWSAIILSVIDNNRSTKK